MRRVLDQVQTDALIAVVTALLSLVGGCLMTGCGPNTEGIERTAGRGFEVVNATLAKALNETSTRTAQLQGNMTAVEPGWVVEGYGIFGTGIVYQGKIYVKGASGTLQGATQTDAGQAGTVTAPANREPTTRSVGSE